MLSELLKFKNGKKLDVAYPIEIRDSNGNVVYIEESDNLWIKYEYNSKGKITYCEDSNNYWSKTEYDDSNGKENCGACFHEFLNFSGKREFRANYYPFEIIKSLFSSSNLNHHGKSV